MVENEVTPPSHKSLADLTIQLVFILHRVGDKSSIKRDRISSNSGVVRLERVSDKVGFCIFIHTRRQNLIVSVREGTFY